MVGLHIWIPWSLWFLGLYLFLPLRKNMHRWGYPALLERTPTLGCGEVAKSGYFPSPKQGEVTPPQEATSFCLLLKGQSTKSLRLSPIMMTPGLPFSLIKKHLDRHRCRIGYRVGRTNADFMHFPLGFHFVRSSSLCLSMVGGTSTGMANLGCQLDTRGKSLN